MKKKYITVLGLCITVLSLTACSNGHKDVQYTEKTYPINVFELDENTVSLVNQGNFLSDAEIEEANRQSQYQQSTGDNTSHEEPSGGELVLENEDTTVNYEIDGENIVYNNKKFNNLYTVVNSVELPYDTNTFINFIVKTVEPSREEVACSIDTNLEPEEEYEIPILNILEEQSIYQKLKGQYNEEVQWCITINDYGNAITIYGCSSYAFLLDTYNDVVIDMSEYDSSTGTNDETTENIEENTEDKGENNEDKGENNEN